jgi:hypothetical protein
MLREWKIMNRLISMIKESSMKVTGYTDGGYTEYKSLDTDAFSKAIINRCALEVDHILREGGGTYGDYIRKLGWDD